MRRGKKAIIIVLIGVVLLVIAGVIYFAQATRNLEALVDKQIGDINLSEVVDGSYEGSYDSFPISVIVAVTVKDSEITKIDIIRHVSGQGGPGEAIVDKVIKAQSLDVDAISGATYSSKVILFAIENALKGEVEE